MRLIYEPVRGYFTTTNKPDGSVIDFIQNYERTESMSTRALAISAGFKRWSHDDFNIAVWQGASLVSWDWMTTPVEAENRLAELALDLERGQAVVPAGDGL